MISEGGARTVPMRTDSANAIWVVQGHPFGPCRPVRISLAKRSGHSRRQERIVERAAESDLKSTEATRADPRRTVKSSAHDSADPAPTVAIVRELPGPTYKRRAPEQMREKANPADINVRTATLALL
jgi:hypothetical protein